jgi:phosphoadenosine phosphosulfate reductase
MLRDRGLWKHIEREVWALEGDSESEGMRLSEKHNVTVAPYFIVQKDSGHEDIYTSVLAFIRACFPNAPKRKATAKPANDHDEIEQAAVSLANEHPREIVRWALERYGEDCAISFSGAEDVALIHLAVETGLPFSTFSLDTGRLHPETLAFIERVRSHYGITIDVMSPVTSELEWFVRDRGLFSFYQEGHKPCCGVRKVGPLRRTLQRRDAWITGQRKDQSPSTRSDLAVVQEDGAFQGRHGSLIKMNPLANWTSTQVWSYIRKNDIPYNELHDQGFISIGCAPCTRAVRPGEHERAARWWWESETQRECGLHPNS